MTRALTILGIETSCDETAAAERSARAAAFEIFRTQLKRHLHAVVAKALAGGIGSRSPR
jgi:tRNA A37 threonylcarbamoyltransferase TsaD